MRLWIHWDLIRQPWPSRQSYANSFITFGSSVPKSVIVFQQPYVKDWIWFVWIQNERHPKVFLASVKAQKPFKEPPWGHSPGRLWFESVSRQNNQFHFRRCQVVLKMVVRRVKLWADTSLGSWWPHALSAVTMSSSATRNSKHTRSVWFASDSVFYSCNL